jgi:hypothetical protein
VARVRAADTGRTVVLDEMTGCPIVRGARSSRVMSPCSTRAGPCGQEPSPAVMLAPPVCSWHECEAIAPAASVHPVMHKANEEDKPATLRMSANETKRANLKSVFSVTVDVVSRALRRE